MPHLSITVSQKGVNLFKAVMLLCSLLIAACSGNDKGNFALGALNLITPSGDYLLTENVPFGTEKRQQMDIYQPVNPNKHTKVVLFVYGGAWRQGIKEDYAYVGQALTKSGYWVVIPDYRLFPEVRFPSFVEDIAKALLATPSALVELGIDPKPLELTLMGHSSGAHTASLIAASPDRWLGERAAVQIEQFIGLSGPYDLPLDHSDVVTVFDSVIGDSENDNPALPIMQMTQQHPETLLIHGVDDQRVLPLHTERYSQHLEQLGVPHQTVWLEGSGHAATVAGLSTVLPMSDEVLQAVKSFLQRP